MENIIANLINYNIYLFIKNDEEWSMKVYALSRKVNQKHHNYYVFKNENVLTKIYISFEVYKKMENYAF